MLKLSFCLAIGEDDFYIQECLNSFSEFADEILVLNVGATPNVLDICKMYPQLKLYSHSQTQNCFEYNYDFLIKEASGDLVVWLESSDILPVSTQSQIEFLKFKSYENISDFIQCPYVYDIDATGSADFNISKTRILKREKYCGFKNYFSKEFICHQDSTSFYLNAPIVKKISSTNFKKLNSGRLAFFESEIDKQGCDPLLFFYFARELTFARRDKEALIYYGKFLSSCKFTEVNEFFYISLTKIAHNELLAAKYEKLKFSLSRIKKLGFEKRLEYIYLDACYELVRNESKAISKFEKILNSPVSKYRELNLVKREIIFYSKIQPLKKLIMYYKNNKEMEKVLELMEKLKFYLEPSN